MTGPLFDRIEANKRRLTQARLQRYGTAPDDVNLWLAQLAICAADMKINNPFPAPSKPVEVIDGSGR
jgi:hypothetical protein